jgi:hypothetical protein
MPVLKAALEPSDDASAAASMAPALPGAAGKPASVTIAEAEEVEDPVNYWQPIRVYTIALVLPE